VISCLLEQRQCSPCEPLELLGCPVVGEQRARVSGGNQRERLAYRVTGLTRPLGRLGCDRGAFARKEVMCVREIELEVSGVPVVFVDGRDLFWWGIRTPAAAERILASLRGPASP